MAAEAPVRVVIEFRVAPGDGTAVAARSADLLRDLGRVQAQSRAGAAQIRRTYVHVLQGVSAVIPASSLAEVRALPYVRGVHADTLFHATAVDGVGIVKASQLWSSLSVRGAGMTAAVLDTGIDYRHAAFGRRVAGGYDFVDDDNDPMDENGHGTHVAGILAGNGGGVLGVAPEATLLAYRVLDRAGNGSFSDLVAALERAVDPNQDGDTSDHVSVVNMSLGGPGTADDAMARAVDAASAAGVVVCAAAGNSIFLGTVGSPALARTAIAVGAVSVLTGPGGLVSTLRAGFSSYGPVGGSFELKPEIVAPGVGITSAKLGGGTTDLSGTSMAAPFVAGVALLVRQIHPSWTPSEVKSAVVSSGGSVFGIGNGGGLLDAVAAASAVVLPSPAQLSFGVAGSGSTERTLSLHLANRGEKKESFTVTVDRGSFDLQATVDPPSFDIEAGDAIDLSVRLSVPAGSASSPIIPGGFLQLAGTDTKLRVPFGVFRGAAVTVRYPDAEFAVWPLPKGNLMQPVPQLLLPQFVQAESEGTIFAGADTYDLLLIDGEGNLTVAEQNRPTARRWSRCRRRTSRTP